jgi:hypothetical protein
VYLERNQNNRVLLSIAQGRRSLMSRRLEFSALGIRRLWFRCSRDQMASRGGGRRAAEGGASTSPEKSKSASWRPLLSTDADESTDARTAL